MNTVINITPEHRFTKVRLGDIKPNRFRHLERWPVERKIIDGLKLSMNERGLWPNMKAVFNEHGEVELCFGHHRLQAALELFGPDHEVALNVGEYQGEFALQRDLHMENSVNRNKVAHIHEVVYNLVHWFDDKIFRLYPEWKDCLAAGIFPRCQLEAFFGPEWNQHGAAEGAGGPGRYKQCAERGIGRRVLAKMLAGTASDEDIRKALENLPMSDQRRRYEEEQAAEVVYSLVHWLDDEVFEKCPTLEDCVKAEIFFRHQLEQFFGPYDGTKVGQTNYKQSVECGVGRNVIAKMLEGTENVGAIQQAIETLPMTERHLSKYRDCRRGPRRGLCRCDPSAPADANVTYKPNF